MSITFNDINILLGEDTPGEGDGVKVKPGERKLLHRVKPFTPNAKLAILCMGVTQHPNTLYEYNTDGIVKRTPVPLGEFHAPLYTCQMLGKWVEIGEFLDIYVENNDEEAHYYASVVITLNLNKK